MKKGAVHRLSARILASALVLAGAACSLVAGLDKLQFSDACTDPCDDGNECTVSDCADAGACHGQPRPDGTGCTTDAGLPGACVGAVCAERCGEGGSCDDGNPCTMDTCIPQTDTCHHVSLDTSPTPGDPGPRGDCHVNACKRGVSTDEIDDNDLPALDNPCVAHLCIDGGPSTPILPAGTKCGDGGAQICNDAGMCGCSSDADCALPETCSGGGVPGYCGCTPTTCDAGGLTCGTWNDGCNHPLRCDDDAGADGTETDVNCGGPSPDAGGTCGIPCALKSACKLDRDCAAGFCANDVCCSSACTHVCTTCGNPNNLGQCINLGPNVQDNTGPPYCNGSNVCDGNGACKKKAGSFCTASSQCVKYCKANQCY